MSVTELSKETIQTKIEGLLKGVEWLSPIEAYVECPGKAMHTTRNATRDCKLYLDEVPTISCFHGSCSDQVSECNKTLRQALRDGTSGEVQKKKLTLEEKRRLKEIRLKEAIRRQARATRERILELYRWPYEAIQNSSPVGIDEDPRWHWRMLLSQFQKDDVVWCGSLYASGREEHAESFKTREEWIARDIVHGQFTCPATFKLGSYARSNANIATRRFLVVESDELGTDEIGSIFRWMREKVGLELRCIVDTAGKSLHAWFEYPPDSTVEELKLVLPELGCDPKLFTASQPVRMPGATRDGKMQRLVYLSKEGAI